MKNCVNYLYVYDNSGVNDGERYNCNWNWSVKTFSHTAANQSNLVSYTDSGSEEKVDLHVDVNFDEPIDLAIN